MLDINIDLIDRDFNKLQKIVGEGFLDENSKKLLAGFISAKVNRLLIENPYIDKDFRDTYYNDFSKRFTTINRNSIRVHLFKNKRIIEDNYLGFFTLRNIPSFNIGRSHINPEAIKYSPSKGYYCLTKEKVHIRGIEFSVEGFPWMQQDTNVSCCAHVAIWEVIRYFSNKYNIYQEITLNKVSELVDAVTRKVPSAGLDSSQISHVLTKAGFSVVQYSRQHDNAFFNKILYILVESGFPVLCILPGHAITIMGHYPTHSYSDFIDKLSKEQLEKLKKRKVFDSSELVSSFISCDDNFFPYSSVGEKGIKYKLDNIRMAIAPLYEKIYIDARQILEFILPRLESRNDILPEHNNFLIRRILLTSSNSFKRFVVEKSEDKKYMKIISKTFMPKFIWIIEYANLENYPEKISHRIIIDSTALNFAEIDDIIINSKLEGYTRFKIDDDIVWSKLDKINDVLYINNLKELTK